MNHETRSSVYFIFALLQALSLGFIVYFLLEMTTIGFDAAIVLSAVFAVSTFILGTILFSKR